MFSGAALVAKNGVPVFMKAYGMANREQKVPNTIRTRFNLGSINKEFTQTAIRQLVRAGKFPGNDPQLGIAGGAPGINGTLETRGEWTVIVLSNFDPPVAERIGVALADRFQWFQNPLEQCSMSVRG